jgi:hypothetical protein
VPKVTKDQGDGTVAPGYCGSVKVPGTVKRRMFNNGSWHLCPLAKVNAPVQKAATSSSERVVFFVVTLPSIWA